MVLWGGLIYGRIVQCGELETGGYLTTGVNAGGAAGLRGISEF